MISSVQLQRLRRSSARLRPDLGEIWRKSANTKTAGGGTTQTFARVATYPIRLAGGGQMERELAGRLGIANGKVITLDVTADVRIDDQIRTGGVTYEVMGFTTPQSKRINQRVICAEMSS